MPYIPSRAAVDLRRRRLVLSLPGQVALASPLALLGCGGSDGDGAAADPASDARVKQITALLPAAPRSAAKVSVTLPAGSGVAAADTNLMTANNIAAVAADGTSAAVLIAQGAQMAYLIDKGGRLLLMGIVDAGTSEVIDSRSTAEALVLLTSQVALLGEAPTIALRKTLRSHPIVEPVRRAVEAAASRGGISVDDSALMAALNAALKSLFPRSAAPAAAGKRAAGLKVLPSEVRSGVAVVPTSDFNTVQWENRFRRRAYIWVSRTGHIGAGGEVTLPTPAAVKDFPLNPTTPLSFDNLVVAVGDYLAGLAADIGALDPYDSGTAPWAPVRSDPLALPLEPADATTTHYQARIVGVGRSAGGSLSAAEATKLEQLQITTLVEDICLPLLRQVILPIIGDRLSASGYDAFTRIRDNLLLNGAIDFASVFANLTYFPKTIAAVKAGDASTVVQLFLTELASSNTWQVLYSEWMRAMVESADPRGAGFGSSDQRDSAGNLIGVNLLDDASLVKANVDKLVNGLNKVARVIVVAKVLATAADYAALAKDWNDSATLVEQTIDATAAKLTLSPNPAEADPLAGAAGKAAITAKLEGLDASLPPDEVFLRWTCTARYGSLYKRGADGTDDFETTLSNATHDYIPSGVQDDPAVPEVVTVVATYRNPTTAARTVIATATSTIKLKKLFTVSVSPAGPTSVPTDTTLPLSAFINESLPTGASVDWTWSLAGAGSLAAAVASGGGRNSTALLNTGSADGRATVTVTARVSVPATATAPAIVITTNPVTAVLDVKAGQRTISFRASGGVFACGPTCGVSDYTAYIVPRLPKATGYEAVFTGFAYGPCNRTVKWVSERGDGGGCNFPVTYHPFPAREAASAWAVWIGFGGPLGGGTCDVTITLAP